MRDLTKQEYCARFKAEMLRRIGEKAGDGSDVAEYADDAATAYFDEYRRNPGDPDWLPEAAAEIDISYWED